MKRFYTAAAVCWITVCIFAGCKKENADSKQQEFLLIKKITGPTLWEHQVAAYGSDSILYDYSSDNHISHITYFGRYESGGVTTSYRTASGIAYDSKGNVQRITLAGDPDILEKEIQFQYDTDGYAAKATVIFRSDGYLINENDSVVITYLHDPDPPGPPVINGQTITRWVSAVYTFYGNENKLKQYLMSQDGGGYAYHYALNKENIPIEIWKSTYVFTSGHESVRYEVVDGSIMGVKRYRNDLFAQGPPSAIYVYERTTIPNVNFQIMKSIFGKNTWISNIGVLSPFHPMEVNTFAKSSHAGSPAAALHFSYQVDSASRKITKSYRDEYGTYQPLTTFYFH